MANLQQQQQQESESQPEDSTANTQSDIVFVVMADTNPTPSSADVEQTSIQPINSEGAY